MIELPEGKQLFRPDEVQELFGTKSIRTIYAWIQDNKLPAIKVGGQWRIKRQTLIDFGVPSSKV